MDTAKTRHGGQESDWHTSQKTLSPRRPTYEKWWGDEKEKATSGIPRTGPTIPETLCVETTGVVLGETGGLALVLVLVVVVVVVVVVKE